MRETEDKIAQLHAGESMELVSTETEFDILERNLITKETAVNVFETVSLWLSEHLDPYFVLIYVDEASPVQSVKYLSVKGSRQIEPTRYIDERKVAGISSTSFFVHPSGCLSIPFSYTTSVTGFVFVGPPLKNKAYTLLQKKLLIPVARILSKSLLFLEIGKMRQEKNKLQYAFSRYVSPDVVQNIVENPEVIQLGGEKQFLSVIFTDLQNFTSMSESMDPVLLVRVLNMYLNEMSQVILALGGTIDKFEGDAIMAFFGAPHKLKDHAVRCCLAALRMKRMEKILNDQLIREHLISIPLHTRIGINTGDMIVGNVGSIQRLDYTIIGRNVNVAARIETANKRYGTSVLISGQTFRLVAPYFECQFLNTAYLKGIREPVPLYELRSEKPGSIPVYENYGVSCALSDKPAVKMDSVEEICELEEL